MEEHSGVIITEKIIEMLPLLAEKIAQPLNNADSIKVIQTGGASGIPAVSKGVTDTRFGIQESLKELTGIDVAGLLKDFAAKGKRINAASSSGVKKETE
ncbi:flotillin domain-containing protein [Domibacillus sp.]|uniref:flotillin domain-containing protein n=1 Tax=Domibacillus sp. TaxID=1969783 RepID=UPI00281131D7|nr:flotillin domain-containing protein [Domibacillus sp.]